MCKYKKCFTCNKSRLLFMYNPNRMKYKLPTDLGKVTECRFCEFKRVTSDSYVKHNFETKKFELLPKLSYWQAFCKVILGIKN